MKWMAHISLMMILIFLSVCLRVHQSYAEIYKYQDENGVWHITDAPADVPEGVKLIETGYGRSYRNPQGYDIQKKLSKSFPPKNAIEQARNATVSIKSKGGDGSGFFVTEDCYILTNKHVVENARMYRIYLIDGTELIIYGAHVSTKHDLALLKLEGFKCPFITPLDARQLADGTQVYAIGSPLGLMNSVTSGICSGRRKFGNTYYIQTNAQISPGNSGGPLITEDGLVVGINTRKIVHKTAEGLGFAIPINTAFDEFNMSLGQRY